MRKIDCELISRITCPNCGKSRDETMDIDACRWFYECAGCASILQPRPGDCCVFCSFGSSDCPPKQTGNACCGQPG